MNIISYETNCHDSVITYEFHGRKKSWHHPHSRSYAEALQELQLFEMKSEEKPVGEKAAAGMKRISRKTKQTEKGQ